jgi:uncharacterized protein (DUF58 family)
MQTSPRMTLRHRLSPARFLRGEGPESGPIILRQRRVYILPSKMGLYFAALLLVMLLGAVNYSNSLAFALTFLLSSVGLVAMLHTYRNLLHLGVDIGPLAPVFCGDTLRAAVLLDNSDHNARYAIQLQFPQQAVELVDVAADGRQRIQLPLPTQKRGRHPLPRITLRTRFPLGLFNAWAHAQRDAHYLVYPTPDNNHPLSLDKQSQFQASGDRGQGADDFAGLRNYHSGDSLRHVHWKTLARQQGMHTKQFGGDRVEQLWLEWDQLAGLETEARLSRLCRWILDAEAAQLDYGLRLPQQFIPLGRGPDHHRRCLEALALFPTEDQGSS